MICIYCGRDIDAIGQDNCSYTLGEPICEDCSENMPNDLEEEEYE